MSDLAPVSRRRLLGAGVLAGAAATLPGCGGPTHHHLEPPARVASGDAAVLSGLLSLERKTIAAYEAGIPLLEAGAARDARQFLGQEESHAAELVELLKKANVTAGPPGSYNLGHPRSAADVLAFIERLETAQLHAYLQAIPKLASGAVRSAAAAMFANDAQHAMVLRTHLHRPAVPTAFPPARV